LLLYQLGNTNIDCGISGKQIIYNCYREEENKGRNQRAQQRIVAKANITNAVVEARGQPSLPPHAEAGEATTNPTTTPPVYINDQHQ
jgi:hypothetical protein